MGNFFLIKHHTRSLTEVYQENLRQTRALPDTRTIGASAAAPPHMRKEQGQPLGALCYPALDTVGRRDRPRIGAGCPFVRLVSGVSEHIIGDRPRPDPVWETARFSVPPASHGCPASISCDWRLP
jgi:hypothetical protein